MFSMLVNVVFWIINAVASAILSPIMGILNVFDNSAMTNVFSSFGDIITIVGNYFLCVIDLLCIPRSLFILLLTVVLGIATWVVAVRTYFFVIMVYRHFKP